MRKLKKDTKNWNEEYAGQTIAVYKGEVIASSSTGIDGLKYPPHYHGKVSVIKLPNTKKEAISCK